jgi:hypothetical protein
MAKRKLDTSGFDREAAADDIDKAAEYARNVEGPREYAEAYNAVLRRKGLSDDEIRAELVKPFVPCPPLPNGIMPATFEQLNVRQKTLLEIRRKGVEDALAGKPPKYKI